jgi:hypothetical protein
MLYKNLSGLDQRSRPSRRHVLEGNATEGRHRERIYLEGGLPLGLTTL